VIKGWLSKRSSNGGGTASRKVLHASSGKIIPLKLPERNAGKLNLQDRGILTRMLIDCRELGASEVFVGYPDPCSYQCFADAEHYSGALPEPAIKFLKKLTANRSPIELDWSECEVEELRLGITKSGAEPVFCFSWRAVKKMPVRVPDSTESTPALKNSTGELILIVDDDRRFLKILSRILEDRGFQTLSAGCGREGLEVLSHFTPALIISDIHMPHLAGPEFLLESRRRNYTGPCLILTNDEEALTEAELILLGATAYIKKSEDPKILLAWCRRLVNIREVA